MDKNFLYLMLGVAIILIVILAMSQNKSNQQQPGELLNNLLISPSPSINLSQQQQQTVTTIPQPISTTTLPSSPSAEQVLEGGLKIQDLVVGQGEEVKNNDTISIHYRGTLEDGTQFDSSYDRGEPFQTQIGVGQVIKGWDLGILGMKVGGKRILTIPPELGYGDQQTGNIPPNSTLIFEVELISIN